MPIYAIEYRYDSRPGVLDAGRPAHRSFMGRLHADGVLLASGPLRGEPLTDDGAAAPGEPGAPGALLLLRADSAQAALRILDDDPFRGAGLIASRTVREWELVTGAFA
ncbi:YciI family protein [Actinotalea sp. Marseille-Q4924]|uniref:YciI family protein n=1 Tax=Actinotalea sp. Marseille-Q4924 TaxID=2866571 RepID=UPI001CE46F09|nr:YciI family protein [Actinotalea sp. Marseille-Q4924]